MANARILERLIVLAEFHLKYDVAARVFFMRESRLAEEERAGKRAGREAGWPEYNCPALSGGPERRRGRRPTLRLQLVARVLPREGFAGFGCLCVACAGGRASEWRVDEWLIEFRERIVYAASTLSLFHRLTQFAAPGMLLLLFFSLSLGSFVRLTAHLRWGAVVGLALVVVSWNMKG